MFIHIHNRLIELPKPVALCVMECSEVKWPPKGDPVPLPEFAEASESHSLVLFESVEGPTGLTFGTQAQMEAVFAALVEAVERGERVFHLDKVRDAL